MKSVIWFFLMCLLFVACGEANTSAINFKEADCTAMTEEDSRVITAEYPTVIIVESRVLLHLAQGTTAHYPAHQHFGYGSVILIDPGENTWDVSLYEGLNTDLLTAYGFAEGWFPWSGEQQYFFKSFDAVPAPTDDPMIDSPAMCSLYLIVDETLSVWLRRTADTVPCPRASNYTEWLPRTSVPDPLLY